jgi:hypothetical protein
LTNVLLHTEPADQNELQKNCEAIKKAL